MSGRLLRAFGVVLLLSALGAIVVGLRNSQVTDEMSISSLALKIKNEDPEIGAIVVIDNDVQVNFTDRRGPTIVHKDPAMSLESQLLSYGVTPSELAHVSIRYAPANSGLLQVLAVSVPLLLLAGLIWLVVRGPRRQKVQEREE